MLCKVLIVDDEMLSRVNLKTLIDWEANDYTVVGEAENGSEAVGMIERLSPQIVVTDVRMPSMSGLDLIAAFSGKPDRPEFLIMSGFDDYDLVRRGLTLGAYDYLLKLEVDAPALLEALRGMRTRLEVKRLDPLLSSSADQQIRRSLPALRKAFFTDLIRGYSYSEQEYERTSDLLGITLFPAAIYCAVIKIGEACRFEDVSYEETAQLQQSIIHVVEDILRDAFHANCFESKQGEFLLFASPRQPEDGSDSLFERTIARLVEMLSIYLNVTAKVGIGASHNESKRIVAAYERAVIAIKNRFYFEGQGIIRWEQVPASVRHSEWHSMLPLKEHLHYAITFQRQDLLNRFFAQFRDQVCRPELSVSAIRQSLIELNYMVREYFETNQLDSDKYLRRSQMTYEGFVAMQDIGEARQWLGAIAADLADLINREAAIGYARIIAISKKHIEEHYGEDLSLTSVALSAGLNPCYFSTIFKRYAQVGFSEYLNHVRINAAKKLLAESDKKVYQVAEACGYHDPHYFNRIFKKVTGLAPGDFQRSTKGIGVR
jgi:two-component system, response regulator YesN